MGDHPNQQLTVPMPTCPLCTDRLGRGAYECWECHTCGIRWDVDGNFPEWIKDDGEQCDSLHQLTYSADRFGLRTVVKEPVQCQMAKSHGQTHNSVFYSWEPEAALTGEPLPVSDGRS